MRFELQHMKKSTNLLQHMERVLTFYGDLLAAHAQAERADLQLAAELELRRVPPAMEMAITSQPTRARLFGGRRLFSCWLFFPPAFFPVVLGEEQEKTCLGGYLAQRDAQMCMSVCGRKPGVLFAGQALCCVEVAAKRAALWAFGAVGGPWGEACGLGRRAKP